VYLPNLASPLVVYRLKTIIHLYSTSHHSRRVVKGLIPEANVWIVPDEADVVDAKIASGNGPEEKVESVLEKALRWAAGKRKENKVDGAEVANLVVLAGSLYLVADFYRFLDQLML
jgi:folylpolyglutamate synthase/dihydropteroate synthase